MPHFKAIAVKTKILSVYEYSNIVHLKHFYSFALITFMLNPDDFIN